MIRKKHLQADIESLEKKLNRDILNLRTDMSIAIASAVNNPDIDIMSNRELLNLIFNIFNDIKKA
jgi:hypothetical protein